MPLSLAALFEPISLAPTCITAEDLLMSTEPAVAAVIGFLVLHEVLTVRALIAILLVTAASVGTSRYS